MIHQLWKNLNWILNLFGLRLVKNKNFITIEHLASQSGNKDLVRLYSFPLEQASLILRYLPKSKGQIKQDIFALSQNNFKSEGFFVEFGATNGIDRSNTYLLEKEFGWQGILAEPGKSWHQELYKNRSCGISQKCVWIESGLEINFSECSLRELSTISNFAHEDTHAEKRNINKMYKVETITLLDLLSTYEAPNIIDFLSIDTEGSEYEILKAFDFSKYQFRAIVCEHNFGKTRDKVYKLLTHHGYSRVYENISEFDDWYILKTEH